MFSTFLIIIIIIIIIIITIKILLLLTAKNYFNTARINMSTLYS